MPKRPGIFDPVLLALLALTVLMVPWFLYRGDERAHSWVVQTGLDVVNTYFAFRMAAHPEMTAAGRRFWRAVVIAFGACALGDGYQTALHFADPAMTTISTVQTVLVLTGMTIVVGAMLRHPLGGAGRQRLRLWFDATTVLTGVAVFLWYYVLAVDLSGRQAADRWGAAATTIVMLLITFGLLKLILSGTAPFTRSAGVTAGLGVVGTALAAPVTTGLLGDPGPGGTIIVQLVPCALVAIGLRLQQLRLGRLAAEARTTAGTRSSRLPYLAVIATQILLVHSLHEGRVDPRVWGVAIGAVVITALVLGRQVAALRDNERLLTELDGQAERFRALVQNTSDLTLVVDYGGNISYASPAAFRVLGLPDEQLVGTSLYDRTHPADHATVADLAQRLSAGPGTGINTQVRWAHADGTYRWLDVICTDLGHNPNVAGVVLNARDATEARALHDELQRQATHDALTGLANRVLLQRRLEAAHEPVSMLLLDLDGFKEINDRHGHHTGDLVLQEVARRLTGLLGTGELAARLGGDEFAVLLPGTGATAAGRLAERIVSAVAEPMPIGGGVLTVGASVGVAAGAPGDGDGLMRQADAAMYRRKRERKQRHARPVAQGAVQPAGT
ncbi:diguanylate cyclase [Actinoplanes sp. NEAU-A12]|uniref:Diguanylate cyclase n=1 Tax=Actinoplanes sandaracinus TaxID=3045177 RepID=A0ABT6WQA8_9ACTN|nr:diguanylate cyclase [Actinoplanes sandaracinus]MDI6101920.1 diguanylate cyclase [Actinoplanes sandaracinus]